MLPRSVELLAPAGNWACLKAAVCTGADAVYFGLSDFNARKRATNFSIEELPKVIDYLHNHNVKGYVTFNTLAFSNELGNAVEFLKAIADSGADAVIVQDVGIALLLSRLAPTLPIHASTQMTLTDAAGINLVASIGRPDAASVSMSTCEEPPRPSYHPPSVAATQAVPPGNCIKRAILARELSLVELWQVKATTDIELEAFAHGALCISYGGQCLASLTLGSRSANRGQCAQPCRMPYQLIVNGKAVSHRGKRYVLSPTDLAAYDRLGQMLEAGVCGFKIEGRLKNEYYVAAAVAAYRAALDCAMSGKDFVLSPTQHARLVQGFSRGFTTGFLGGKDHQKLVHGRFPKSRGMYVGTVEAKGKSGITIAFAADQSTLLKAGDGVVIDGAGLNDEQGGRIYMVKAAGTNKAALMFGMGDIDFSKIAIGAAIWKTDDPAVRRQIEQTFNTDRIPHPVPITVSVHAKLGEPLTISLADNQGHTASVQWDTPLESAQNYALNLDAIREQVGRLGNTPFTLADIKIEHLDTVMVPRSVLNDLRRKAVEELVAIRANDAKHTIVEPAALENLHSEIKQAASAASRPQTELAILVRTIEQFTIALEFARSSKFIAMLYCDFADTDLYGFAAAKARAASVPLGIATLRINKPGDEESLKAIVDCKPDMVLVRNLAALAYFRNHVCVAATELCEVDGRMPPFAIDLPLVGHCHPSQQLKLIGDFSLNIANELAASVLIGWGVLTMTPSYDLSIDQLRALVSATSPAWFEQVMYDHIPMFHTEHCLAANMLSTGKDNCSCGRPCRNAIELEDTKSLRYQLVTDVACRSTIYHPTVFCAAAHIELLKTIGLRRFRISLLNEDPAQTKTILGSFTDLLTGKMNAAETV
ncbi:MAG: DUF3656 domain-containing protein, partial [Sedimentisphaerales bacterium]|nr:DUF3656 domain-containing protein [Sedimentisphaerales bacterium]